MSKVACFIIGIIAGFFLCIYLEDCREKRERRETIRALERVDKMEDSVKKSKGVTKKRRGYSVDELNAELDSLTAQGEYMLVRGSDREYETIVGHIKYICERRRI